MVKYTLPLNEGHKKIVIDILKKHPELVEYLRIDDLGEFFHKLYSFCSDNDISRVVQFLYESNVDVLSYLNYIPRCAFIYSSIEKEFIVPSHIEVIKRDAFQCSDIKSLKFEKNSQLKEIGEYVFFSTNLLGDIYLPDSIESLYLSAFQHTRVKSILAPGKCIIKDYSIMRDKVKAKLVIR